MEHLGLAPTVWSDPETGGRAFAAKSPRDGPGNPATAQGIGPGALDFNPSQCALPGAHKKGPSFRLAVRNRIHEAGNRMSLASPNWLRGSSFSVTVPPCSTY